LYCILALAACAGGDRKLALAATLHCAAQHHFERAGFNLQSWERAFVSKHEKGLLAASGEDGFAAARAEGEKLSKEEAVELALGHTRLKLVVESTS
jgi:hypothetical protein